MQPKALFMTPPSTVLGKRPSPTLTNNGLPPAAYTKQASNAQYEMPSSDGSLGSPCNFQQEEQRATKRVLVENPSVDAEGEDEWLTSGPPLGDS